MLKIKQNYIFAVARKRILYLKSNFFLLTNLVEHKNKQYGIIMDCHCGEDLYRT